MPDPHCVNKHKVILNFIPFLYLEFPRCELDPCVSGMSRAHLSYPVLAICLSYLPSVEYVAGKGKGTVFPLQVRLWPRGWVKV